MLSCVCTVFACLFACLNLKLHHIEVVGADACQAVLFWSYVAALSTLPLFSPLGKTPHPLILYYLSCDLLFSTNNCTHLTVEMIKQSK